MKRFILVLTTVFLMFMVRLFPLSCKDIMWASLEVNSFYDIFNISQNGFIINIFNIILSKNTMIRMVIEVFLIITVFVLLRNIINKKNNSLFFLGLFLFLLVDRDLFAHTMASLSGFSTNFISLLCLLLLLNYCLKPINYISNILLFFFGFIVVSTEPTYSITALIIIILYTFMSIKNGNIDNGYVAVLVGSIIGILIHLNSISLPYDRFSYNLLYNFIPIVTRSNYLISLILIMFTTYIGIKSYLKNRDLRLIICLLSIFAYFFIIFFINNIYLNYILYVIFNINIYYIFYSFTLNPNFKNRVNQIFVFKLIFILVASFLGNITFSSLLFVQILDIILILLLYNYVFPKDFLLYLLGIVTCIYLISYIYIYDNIRIRNSEMNKYIKDKLECSTGSFQVPLKYKSEYLIDQLPSNKDELNNYINYYDINVYDLKERELIEFKS